MLKVMTDKLDKHSQNKPQPKTGPLTEAEKRTIRHMYVVHGWSQTDIAIALNRNKITIHKAIRRGRYKEMKQRLDNKLVQNILKNIETDLSEAFTLNLAVLKRAAMQTLRSGKDVSVKDQKLSSDIMANLFRIIQVRQGKPDSIKKVESMTDHEMRETQKEILRMMKEDPMLDVDYLMNEQNDEEPVIN